MDTLGPKQALAEAQQVIKKRGGMPKGKTIALLLNSYVGHPVTLSYYKTPRTFQQRVNKGHQEPVITDADVADMEQNLRNGKKYVIYYILFEIWSTPQNGDTLGWQPTAEEKSHWNL